MILDLKGKLELTGTNELVDDTSDELIEVLKGLGYKDKEIKTIIPQVNKDNKIEDQVKEALRLLVK